MDGSKRVVILGAAGRDFHLFNVVFRDDPHSRVVAFTAAQIPDIAGRRYPPALSGPRYPDGIPILAETALERIVRDNAVAEVVFAYSDVTHEHVMHLASRALAAGADFRLYAPHRSWLAAAVPVIAVCAVRTGCGKSSVARWLAQRLAGRGRRVAVLRHPMPYGDLERQAVQRFACRADLDAANCPIEEREEYEPHLVAGNVVWAGVDYARILAAAQTQADVLLWDGGNNDAPFVRSDLLIVLVDALRPRDLDHHHPGETVLRLADVVLIAKSDAAPAATVEALAAAVRAINPAALIVRGASPLRLDTPEAVRGRRVLVVEDGPTTTHGGMPWGGGFQAAQAAGAAAIIDPRPYADPQLAAVYSQYPQLGPVLPAMGYSAEQCAALARTIRAVPADAVVVGTPVDLAALIAIDKPVLRVRYAYAEAETPGLGGVIDEFLSRR